MVLHGYIQDSFPCFDDKEINGGSPDLEPLTDDSDSESGSIRSTRTNSSSITSVVAAQRATYLSKENQDVLMFLQMADKMSVKSLLFILQNHARSMHNIPQGELDRALAKNGRSKSWKKPLYKKLRFAEIMGGQQVRVSVKEIPNNTTFTPEEKEAMWWTREEQSAMRSHAARVVRHFRDGKPDYAQSIELMADSYLPDISEVQVDYHVKRVARDFSARGLETHIVSSLKEDQRASVQAVLREQQRQRELITKTRENDPPTDCLEEPCEIIRKKYKKCSRPCRTLAFKMAECDYMEALKASLSSWALHEAPNRRLSRWQSE